MYTKAKYSLRVLFLIAGLAAILQAGSVALGGELQQATILPQWAPQAQFAGIYVAKDKGFYEQQGVDMTVLRGGPKCPTRLLLSSGKVDFATMFLTTAIKLASQDEDIINLAQLVHRSSLLLVARKADGILSPADLNNKRISTWGPEFSLQIDEFLRKHGVRVKTLPQGFTVNLFLREGVHAVSAMWYNEYHTLLNSGLDKEDLTVFAMADYGLNYPEDGLYCMRPTYEANPELCCAVARATLEGWRYAFAHPEEALDMVMRRAEEANLPTNRVHQRWMLARMRDIIAPDGEVNGGALSREEFESVARSMRDAGLIHAIPPYEAFHVQCAVPR